MNMTQVCAGPHTLMLKRTLFMLPHGESVRVIKDQ